MTFVGPLRLVLSGALLCGAPLLAAATAHAQATAPQAPAARAQVALTPATAARTSATAARTSATAARVLLAQAQTTAPAAPAPAPGVQIQTPPAQTQAPATQTQTPAAQNPALVGAPDLSAPLTPAPGPPQGRVLEMDQALQIAQEHAPELREAAAQTRAAKARIGSATAPLLPQVTATASYTRSTYNSPLRGYTTVAGTTVPSTGDHATLDSRDVFGATLRASQLIYDFGQSWRLRDVAEANAQAQEQTEHATELQIAYTVRNTFLNAGANRALVEVARATLSNQERHLTQIQGFVEVGTRAPIDLAQSRTDVANAKLALIRAQNNYAAARAELSRAMGTPSETGYEVSGALPPPEESETTSLENLVQVAERQRPEFAAIHKQYEAQQAQLSSIKGQYGPSLNLVGSLDEQGYRLSEMATNLSAGVSLNWPIFQGGLTNSRVDEAKAILTQIEAQLETLRQDLRVSLTQAELGIQAAQAALAAADELVTYAKERVTLAEGRYQTGVGSIIELGDAELAMRDAQTQHVTAEYDLANARALLHRTLGRL